VLSWRISLPGSRYSKIEDRQAFFKRATEEIGRIPGVEYCGSATWIPLTRGGNWQTIFDVEGVEPGRRRKISHPRKPRSCQDRSFRPWASP
jgi:hypothetical protein